MPLFDCAEYILLEKLYYLFGRVNISIIFVLELAVRRLSTKRILRPNFNRSPHLQLRGGFFFIISLLVNLKNQYKIMSNYRKVFIGDNFNPDNQIEVRHTNQNEITIEVVDFNSGYELTSSIAIDVSTAISFSKELRRLINEAKEI